MTDKLHNILTLAAFVLLALAALVHMNEGLNTLALYGAIPLAFILMFVAKGKLPGNVYMKWIMALYLWVAITSFYAPYHDYAVRELRQILGSFLVCFIIMVLAEDNERLYRGYVVFFLLFAGAGYYAKHYIFGADFAFGDDRANDDQLNANTIAYYTFFLIYMLYMLPYLMQGERGKRLARYAYFMIFPFLYWVAIATGSRQVLLIIVPFALLLLGWRYICSPSTSKRKRIMAICVIAIALLAAAPSLISRFQDSFLMRRMGFDVGDDLRVTLMREAIEVGNTHPLLGLGAGNFRAVSSTGQVSHTTFTDLYANTGIIGVMLFIALLYTAIKRQIQHLRETKDEYYLFTTLFFLFFTAYQMFYVFYTDQWLMAFFVLAATQSETYYYSHI